jgi:outer membrane murein-binding lipoprotein Lpp
MNAKHRVLIAAGLVGCLALAGCSTSPPKATAPAANSSPAAQQASANFKPLLRLINSTRKAVKAADFASAQTEFGKFDAQWSILQDSVKAKSPEAHSVIEAQKQQLAAALQSNDQRKAWASLKTLKATVMQVSQ